MCLGETGCQEKGTITLENKRLLSFLVQTRLYEHAETKSSECDILRAIVANAKGVRNMEKEGLGLPAELKK